MFVGGGDDFPVANRTAGLDHRGDARRRRGVDAVAEGEKSVGCHHRTRHGELLVRRLDAGEPGAVDPAHLPGADADGPQAPAINDGVGFDVSRHGPGEAQIAAFRFIGMPLADHGQFIIADFARIGVLDKQPAIDALQVEPRRALPRPLPAGEHADVRFRPDRGERLLRDRWRDNHLAELPFEHPGRGGPVEFAVEGDDAAESRGWIGCEGRLVGRERRLPHRHPAGVGMFDDDAGAAAQRLDAFEGGVGVHDVVEGQRLALQLPRPGDAAIAVRKIPVVAVERRGLVGVLAVAEILLFGELAVEGAGKALRGIRPAGAGAEIVGDHAVIARAVLEGGGGEFEARGFIDGPGAGFERRGDAPVIIGIDHHGDEAVVLRRRPQQGRPADVDIFDGLGEFAIRAAHSLFKRIEIHHHEVDGRDAVLFHRREIHIPAGEDAAVYLRMQGFDAAVHQLRESGVGGNFDGVHAGLPQQAAGAAG